nr:NAD-specific glutamate dehydrogenase [Ipomoea batatas]GMC99923.1 NAD-specific glutamate dehydrogenase [Ipomoea batatas]GMD01546.1 NAD-specific glutamate dehydrogenase [Ipomoea batatas]GMD34197.1 NAD-specific glutamate dehydrogenase [Ipomoea batatas]GMD68458.1 NAD-specific glutamate dehydrogenase [Ipomoea batatas]
MGVTISGKNLEDTIINGQDTDIKCSTTEIKYEDIFLTTFLVQSIGNGSGSWFINNSCNIKSSNNTCILGSLPLSIIENHGTDFLRAEDFNFPISDFDLYIRLAILVNNLVRNKLHIPLDFLILKPVNSA